MVIVLGIIFLFLIYYFFLRNKPKKVGQIHSNQNHYFDKLQFSSDDFYTLVEKLLTERQMPDTKVMRTNYHEASILSNKREYLRVERKEDVFDICAAPFGTGFFVSYWHGEPKHAMRDMAMKIPYLSTVVDSAQGTTYFKEDTASMFRACVKDSITEAIEQITTSKGVRGFSEAERMAFSK
jgi:hypothetical protein